MSKKDFTKNKFKDVLNRWRTQSLFIDTQQQWNQEEYPPMYTLQSDDFEGYPSMRRLYLEENDPTEYSVAAKYFGGWEHWLHMKSLAWFEKHRTRWAEELEIKMQSEAVHKLVELSKDSKSAMSATNAIINKVWKEKTRGRPNKDEVERQKRIAVGITKTLDDDFKMLKLDERKTKTD